MCLPREGAQDRLSKTRNSNVVFTRGLAWVILITFRFANKPQALLSVFRQRYLDSKDKDTAIEKCELTLGDKPTRGECRILVRFICKHGISSNFESYVNNELIISSSTKGS